MKSSILLEMNGDLHNSGVRPFFWKLAAESGLNGWVANSREGILLHLEAETALLSSFIRSLPASVPASFRLRSVCVLKREAEIPEEKCLPSFRILDPNPDDLEIPPDRMACPECVKDVLDPASRRYCYPFFSCSDSGPGYSFAIRSPLIRKNSSLTAFPMCSECKSELQHADSHYRGAELLACPRCGPQFFLLDMYGDLVTAANPLCQARVALKNGEILAVQSIYGGFQLYGDALNPATIQRLRRKRNLPYRPLCVTMRNLETVRKYCECSEAEGALLSSPASPVVILRKKTDCPLPEMISPDTDTLAVGLPSSLQEKLLFEHQSPGMPLPFEVLVTCGDNRPGKAECQEIDEIFNRLMAFTDKFLCHDLKTGQYCPPSICQIYQGRTFFHRRARGYVPQPIAIKERFSRNAGAFGCDIQAAVALGIHSRIIPSQALGTLGSENDTALLNDMFERFTWLFDQVPEIMACDMDRDSFSAQACAEFADLHGLPLITIQTHHAHALACMAEHGLKHSLALVMNRGAIGPDGTVWGSECLDARLDGFSRLAAFRAIPQETTRPARTFLDYLIARHTDPAPELLNRLGVDAAEYELWCSQTPQQRGPLSCSALQLISAVCAGLGIISGYRTYSDRALLRLQSYAARFVPGTPIPDNIAILFQFRYSEENGFRQIDWSDTIERLSGLNAISETEKIMYAEAFYNALAESMLAMALFAESRTGIGEIVLSGSLFLDPILCRKTKARLEARSFRVFTHVDLAGDESCVPVGQAYAAGLVAET